MEASRKMRLAQARLVTNDVERLAAFYADLIGAQTTLNPYYVEIPAGHVGIAFSKPGFTAYPENCRAAPEPAERRMILDFVVADVDAQYARIDGLGVTWVMAPTTQPWGSRAMTFHDPEGNPVNIFCVDPDQHR
jgi:uncharacterized glyoxalase superfamily protein PhnB